MQQLTIRQINKHIRNGGYARYAHMRVQKVKTNSNWDNPPFTVKIQCLHSGKWYKSENLNTVFLDPPYQF